MPGRLEAEQNPNRGARGVDRNRTFVNPLLGTGAVLSLGLFAAGAKGSSMGRIQSQSRKFEHTLARKLFDMLWGALGISLLVFLVPFLHADTLGSKPVLKPSGHVAVGAAPSAGPAAFETTPRGVIWFEGACDASGAVELDALRLAVADDEDNVIRIYDANRGGPPLFQHDFSKKIGSSTKDRFESDIEAATRHGQHAFFLTSHGRTSKGKLDANRLLFFASELPHRTRAPRLFGKPYRSLHSDMLKDPRLARFGLQAALRLAPKEPGGLNIEGLTAARDGSFWIGFRSPVPEGRALLVRLLNPLKVLQGQPAQFSEPVLLDLGGLGVRALTSFRSQILIMAGPPSEAGPSRLYQFDEATRMPRVLDVDFEGLNPEAFFSPEQRDELLVLSDDGTQRYGGKPCKRLKNQNLKRFRGLWVKPALNPAPSGD